MEEDDLSPGAVVVGTHVCGFWDSLLPKTSSLGIKRALD